MIVGSGGRVRMGGGGGREGRGGGGTKHRKECIRQAIIGGIKTGKPYTAYPKT
jgi:hypothetical protein